MMGLDFYYRHPKWLVGFAVMFPVVVFALFFFARGAPIVVGPQTDIPSVFAGEELKIDLPVKRDLSQFCSMSVSRDIITSTKERRSLTPTQEVGAEGIRDRAHLSPDRLKLLIVIPQTIPSGESHILTNAAFRCTKNPTTWIWPIEVNYDWKFNVIPPVPKTIVVIAPMPRTIPAGTPSDPLSVTIQPAASGAKP